MTTDEHTCCGGLKHLLMPAEFNELPMKCCILNACADLAAWEAALSAEQSHLQ